MVHTLLMLLTDFALHLFLLNKSLTSLQTIIHHLEILKGFVEVLVHSHSAVSGLFAVLISSVAVSASNELRVLATFLLTVPIHGLKELFSHDHLRVAGSPVTLVLRQLLLQVVVFLHYDLIKTLAALVLGRVIATSSA